MSSEKTIEKIEELISKIGNQNLSETSVEKLDKSLLNLIDLITDKGMLRLIYSKINLVQVKTLPYSPHFYWNLVFRINEDKTYKSIVKTCLPLLNSRHWLHTFFLNCLYRIQDTKFVINTLTQNPSIVETMSIDEITSFLERDKTSSTFNDRYWISMYETFKGSKLSLAVIPLIFDQNILFQIAMDVNNSSISHLAIENINDKLLLEKICFGAMDSRIRVNAFMKLGDDEEIAFRFAKEEADDVYRRLGFEKIRNLKYLQILLLIETNDRFRSVIKNRIRKVEKG